MCAHPPKKNGKKGEYQYVRVVHILREMRMDIR